MRRAPALILGGGPAGLAAAIGLARGGVTPLVLERTRATEDALCGGFLSWNTAAMLARAGVDVAALGAPAVTRVALFAGRHAATARLPRVSYSLSRRAMDTALTEAALAAGAGVERGVTVARWEEGQAILSDGAAVAGDATILATGKHDLRGARRPGPDDDPAIGLRWRLPAGAALRALIGDAVELHLFAGGYVGLALQEDGTANLCLALHRSVLTAAGGDPARLLEQLAAAHPHLAARVDAASDAPGAAQAVANVPYGWIAQAVPDAPYRIGDQAAVIPSLAGEGIAIALASGAAAARAVLVGQDARWFQHDLATHVRRPVRVAATIRAAAERPTSARGLVGAVRAIPMLAGLAARWSRVGV